MRRKSLKTCLLLPLLLAAAASSARAQGFDYDAYQPRTLAEMIGKYDNEELADRKMKDGSSAFGASFPSRVRVVHTGESRKIPDARKQFVADWVKTYQMDARLLDLFESEWKFVEEGVEHWLPVQKQVASFFEKELKKGEAVDLYVIIAGGRRAAGRWDWVILVNEFEKVEPPKPAE